MCRSVLVVFAALLSACSLSPSQVRLPDGRSGFAIENCRSERDCKYRSAAFCGHEQYGVLENNRFIFETRIAIENMSEMEGTSKGTSRTSVWNWVIDCDPDHPIIDANSTR